MDFDDFEKTDGKLKEKSCCVKPKPDGHLGAVEHDDDPYDYMGLREWEDALGQDLGTGGIKRDHFGFRLGRGM